MNIGIVIITHNKSAKALLETTEMLCGKQENIVAVNFFQDMDNISLSKSCEEGISKLNIQEGIIFLVDVFGGTPFNVAYILSKKYKNAKIISGVSIPMIIEACEIREENISLDDKIISIKNAAIEVIKGIDTSLNSNLDDE